MGVELVWGVKNEADRIEALRELERPRVGRQARRTGTVETVTVDRGEDLERAKLSDDLAASRLLGTD